MFLFSTYSLHIKTAFPLDVDWDALHDGGMNITKSILLIGGIVIAGCCLSADSQTYKTENVVLIVSDGLRWQEVFSGADNAVITKELGDGESAKEVRGKYWRETPDARRQALMPFFWSEVAKKGQLVGNQTKGSKVSVTNGHKFSYPGYNEMLTGYGDPAVDSNDKKLNANTNVFEWMSGRPGFDGKVAVMGTWDDFPYIFNIERNHLPIWPAWEPRFAPYAISAPAIVTNLMADTPCVLGVVYDSFLYYSATDYIRRVHPRLLFVGFGETDEWAHEGNYKQYLDAAHRVDDFVRRLWEEMQAMSEYCGKTTFIITADHGRGSGIKDWRDHGKDVNGAENVWLAVMGPDTPALGERNSTKPMTSSQIAATIAELFGGDFHAAFPRVGKPLTELFSTGN